jgi:hypothetical protein
MCLPHFCSPLAGYFSGRPQAPDTRAPAGAPLASGTSGAVGARSAKIGTPKKAPQTNSNSSFWASLARRLRQAGRWLSRTALQLVLTESNRRCAGSNFKNTLAEFIDAPDKRGCAPKLSASYRNVKWMCGNTEQALASALGTMDYKAALKVKTAAEGELGLEWLVASAGSRIEETPEGALVAVLQGPYSDPEWGAKFQQAWSNASCKKINVDAVLSEVRVKMELGSNSGLFAAAKTIPSQTLRDRIKPKPNALKEAGNNLINAFQSDSPDRDLATKAIRVLEAAGENSADENNESPTLMSALGKMDAKAVISLHSFLGEFPSLKSMLKKVNERKSSQAQLQGELKENLKNSLALLKTSSLQSQIPIWNKTNELSKAASKKGCNLKDAVRQVLINAELPTWLALAQYLPYARRDSALKEFCATALGFLIKTAVLSPRQWQLLDEREMAAFKALLVHEELKHFRGSWEAETRKRADFKSRSEFAFRLGNILSSIEPGPESKALSLNGMPAIADAHVSQIMAHAVANTRLEKLQHISGMASGDALGQQLIQEVQAQLVTPQASLMDDAHLLARLGSTSSPEAWALLTDEASRRSRLAYEAAASALESSLSDESPKSWLYGLITFLDQEKHAAAFAFESMPANDVQNALIAKLKKLENEESISVRKRLTTVHGVLEVLLAKMQSPDPNMQELRRLHDGVQEIRKKLRQDMANEEADGLAHGHAQIIERAISDYFGIRLPVEIVPQLDPSAARKIVEIELNQQAIDRNLSRPYFNKEGDPLPVCPQFVKDANRIDIVIGGQLLDSRSKKGRETISQQFIQQLRGFNRATDTQIMAVSKIVTQSPSNACNELSLSMKLFPMEIGEALISNQPEAEGHSILPFGKADTQHTILQGDKQSLKVRTVLTDDRIGACTIDARPIFTDPEKSSCRVEVEFIIDHEGNISSNGYIAAYFHRTVIPSSS